MKQGDTERAAELIKKAEADLGYKLTDGQKGDLLADNFNHWPLDYIRHVIADLPKPREEELESEPLDEEAGEEDEDEDEEDEED